MAIIFNILYIVFIDMFSKCMLKLRNNKRKLINIIDMQQQISVWNTTNNNAYNVCIL